MDVRKIFVIILMLFASSVFAQTTHMGVPAKDMVVLKAMCASFESNPTCSSLAVPAGSAGKTYDRILSDGSVEQDFQMPLRKVLVITDWEWRYSEETVMEDSANDPVVTGIGSPVYEASFSESSLRVTDGDPLSKQGHATGATQMTSGFVVAKLPMWTVNRVIVGPSAPPLSQRSFFIVLRGYLLDVP